MNVEARIVFFGLDGAFSERTLEALAAAGLSPKLVVKGESSRIRSVRSLSPQPGLMERVLGKPRAGLLDAARRLGVPAMEVTHPDDRRLLRGVARARPEIFVVAGFHKLLPSELLALATKGGLNLHPGKLPEERGPSPVFWALKSGRTRHTFTIHLLDPGEDSGDVVSTGAYEVPVGVEGSVVLETCARAAAPFLMRAIRDLLRGEIVRVRQDHSKAGRCPRPSIQDARIDVRKSAEECFVFVSGCVGSYPVYAECAGDRFFVRKAVSYDVEAKLAYDFVLTGNRMILRTNPGVIELELEPDGTFFSAEYAEDSR